MLNLPAVCNMSLGYWERVKDTLFRYSLEKFDLGKAKNEWRAFLEDVVDHGASKEEPDANYKNYPNCGLCGHQNIRYSFIIRNLENDNWLEVGSECITRFIPIEEAGEVLNDPIKKKNLLQKSIRKVIRDNHIKCVIKDILDVQRHDENFDSGGFLKYFDTKHGFTLKQINFLLSLYKKQGIKYDIRNYRLDLRTKVKKEQLFRLEQWQFDNLKLIIPLKFKKEYVSFYRNRG
jgi:stalled ribosome alternative rescue factor ArfA